VGEEQASGTFLPIDGTVRAQVIGLGGVLIVALASTTLLGNAIAGVLLRIVGNFQVGDWVRVEGQFGRVTERGLFHTEIATEDRDLTTLPNLYLATKPVTVVRASGTFVTADVSLGYDIGHQRVKEILLRAAQNVAIGDPPEGLKDAFVHVRELGDFSVTYRVGGLLKSVKLLLSARSRLRAAMLTALHEADVEIVSPTFMNTRALSSDRRILPNSILAKLAAGRAAAGTRERETVLEEVATDKADEAEVAELRGAGTADLEADRVDTASRLEQAGVEVEAEPGENGTRKEP
jgi:small-conductance mechanosensitive channel